MKAVKRFLFLTFVVLAGAIASIVLLGQIPDVMRKINDVMAATIFGGFLVLTVIWLLAWWLKSASRVN